jgi:hypothetical protein
MEVIATKRVRRNIITFVVFLGITAWVILVYHILFTVGYVRVRSTNFFGITDFFEQWNLQMTLVLILIITVTSILIYLNAHTIGKFLFQTRTRVDYAEKYFLHNIKDDWQVLTYPNTFEHSQRFGINYPGFTLGRELQTKNTIYCSLENQMLMLAGPGAGKTSGFVIPFILSCPGPVVSTSNKDDVFKATWMVRKTRGETFLFDIMGITGLPQQMWYNPLRFVSDEATAATVSGHFLLAAEDVKQKSFWNAEGQSLVANYLLAAAKLHAPITRIYEWVSAKSVKQAIKVLEKYQFDGAAKTLSSYVKLPAETKGGIFATARYIIAPLANKSYAKWITQPRDTQIKEFDPTLFVQGSGTIFALSSEKTEGNASALVSTLCNHITDEAETYAKRSANSHLPQPMLIALDEAANICKWAKLPDLYSYYRAYGITLLTALQSYAQGLQVWGKEGMEKMWSAANIILFLGGITEIGLLKNISLLCGQYEYGSYSSSHKPDGFLQSSQISDNRVDILTPSELQVWPQAKNKRTTWGLFPPRIYDIYQPRRTLMIAPDGVLILETDAYFKTTQPQVMRMIKRGEIEYESEKARARTIIKPVEELPIEEGRLITRFSGSGTAENLNEDVTVRVELPRGAVRVRLIV